MAELELAAILELLRKLGLSECESALMEDIVNVNRFSGCGSSKGSSSDEFVSLGSSGSSDGSSEFGTAQDYPDSDMPNEDVSVTPYFDDKCSDGHDQSHEDKFILMPEGNADTNCESRLFGENDIKDGELIEDDNFDLVDDGESHEPESTLDMEDEYEVIDLRIIHRKNRTGFEENKDFPIVLNSVIVGRYYVEEFLGSAAFSRVVRAHDLHSGIDVCLKIIKNSKDFFDQGLDEIKLLKFVNKNDPADEYHILRLYDYFYHQEHLFIVTELLRANLYEIHKCDQESDAEPYFTLQRLQVITRQCLEALSYLHDLGIVHCDLKPENIMIKSYQTCEIKIIDLGSSCFQTDNLSLYVQSRSYRAPEVMLGLQYDQKIDLWSIGCILAELYSGEVLFPNEPVGMILARIIGMLGPIDMDMLRKGQETHMYFTKEHDLYYMNEDTNELEYMIPVESSLEHHLQISDSLLLDFLSYMLEINPERRPTAREALEHPWLCRSYAIEGPFL